MIIDKAKIIANWCIKSTHIDDIAYALYVKHCDLFYNKEKYVVDQSTFIILHSMLYEKDDWNRFYDDAKTILRNKKLEKIKSNDKRRIKK